MQAPGGGGVGDGSPGSGGATSGAAPQDAPLTAAERGLQEASSSPRDQLPSSPPAAQPKRPRRRAAWVAAAVLVVGGGAVTGLTQHAGGSATTSSQAEAPMVPTAVADRLRQLGYTCLVESEKRELEGCYLPDTKGGASVRWQQSGDDVSRLRIVLPAGESAARAEALAGVVTAVDLLPGWDSSANDTPLRSALAEAVGAKHTFSLAGWVGDATAVSTDRATTVTLTEADSDTDDSDHFHRDVTDGVAALTGRGFDCSVPGDEGRDADTVCRGTAGVVTLTDVDGDLVGVDAVLAEPAVGLADLTDVLDAVAGSDVRELDTAVAQKVTGAFAVSSDKDWVVTGSPTAGTAAAGPGRHITVEPVRW